MANENIKTTKIDISRRKEMMFFLCNGYILDLLKFPFLCDVMMLLFYRYFYEILCNGTIVNIIVISY